MAKYVTDEELWLDTYVKAWKIATTNNHKGLTYLDDENSSKNPTDVDCSVHSRRRSCKKDVHCEWGITRTFTTKKGKKKTKKGCVPINF